MFALVAHEKLDLAAEVVGVGRAQIQLQLTDLVRLPLSHQLEQGDLCGGVEEPRLRIVHIDGQIAVFQILSQLQVLVGVPAHTGVNIKSNDCQVLISHDLIGVPPTFRVKLITRDVISAPCLDAVIWVMVIIAREECCCGESNFLESEESHLESDLLRYLIHSGVSVCLEGNDFELQSRALKCICVFFLHFHLVSFASIIL